jgi:hypothetical protein
MRILAANDPKSLMPGLMGLRGVAGRAAPGGDRPARKHLD